MKGFYLPPLALALVLAGSASCARETAQFQSAPEFLFSRRPFRSPCAPPPPGAASGSVILLGRLPFERNNTQRLTLPLSEVPALTLTADSGSVITIAASNRDEWTLDSCTQAEGNTESEALSKLQHVSMQRVGDTVSLTNSNIADAHPTMNNLLVQAPTKAPVVVHASFTAVEVHDMAAPIRVTATHARATILDTTGTVDAAGFLVDYAGSKGTVSLSSETEINLKLRAPRFEGSLMAWAQGPVRVLVPPSFETPFQVVVSRQQDFACRADLCSQVTLKKQGTLCIFTFPGNGTTPPSALHFRSERQTVVVDNSE